MKKLMALRISLVMVFSVVGSLADVDAANVADQPEFQVMTLGNYKYGEDYTSLYDKYGANITIADVTEDEETGFGYITVDGEEKLLGLDFLTMAMVYNTTPAGDYETEDDVYAAWWRLYITRWNYLLPEVPLYSNEYYDLYNAQIKGVDEYPTNPFWSPASALIDWSSEKEDNSIILGNSTELSGQFRYAAFGKSSPGASDNDVEGLTSGLETVSTTKEGGYTWNETVVDSHEEVTNEDGSLTYTIKIKDDLKFSDGSAVTAKDYLAFTMAFGSPVGTEAASRESSYRTVVGWQGAYQKYTGPGSEEGTKEFAGLHLIDDYTFSVTVPADYANYFYKITYGAFSANYAAAWLGEGVEIKDDGNGCYLSDEFYAKDADGKYIQAANIKKLCTDISEENYAAFPWSGPYAVKSFDNTDSTATLVKNEYFKGNYEGATPKIGTIIYKRIVPSTQIEDLKAGGLDVIAAITGGAETDEALKLADESEGKYVYTHYSRAGYGKLGFRAWVTGVQTCALPILALLTARITLVPGCTRLLSIRACSWTAMQPLLTLLSKFSKLMAGYTMQTAPITPVRASATRPSPLTRSTRTTRTTSPWTAPTRPNRSATCT